MRSPGCGRTGAGWRTWTVQRSGQNRPSKYARCSTKPDSGLQQQFVKTSAPGRWFFRCGLLAARGWRKSTRGCAFVAAADRGIWMLRRFHPYGETWACATVKRTVKRSYWGASRSTGVLRRDVKFAYERRDHTALARATPTSPGSTCWRGLGVGDPSHTGPAGDDWRHLKVEVRRTLQSQLTGIRANTVIYVGRLALYDVDGVRRCLIA